MGNETVSRIPRRMDLMNDTMANLSSIFDSLALIRRAINQIVEGDYDQGTADRGIGEAARTLQRVSDTFAQQKWGFLNEPLPPKTPDSLDQN